MTARDAFRADAALAGVELGGTKTIAVLMQGGAELDRLTVPTTDADATLGAIAERLAGWRRTHAPAALGVASFGPVGIHPGEPGYGHILPTPKPGWAGADVLGRLRAALPCPVRIETDVTAASLAEGRAGAAVGLADFVYVTIGTGIGGGIIAGGKPVAGRMHPEIGHLLVRRIAGDDFAGVCPFHGDCLEGLASGPAIQARAGRPATALASDDPAWTFVADAIAEGFASLLLTLAPEAILVGGGVGVGQAWLLPAVRARIAEKVAGYLPFVDDASLEATIRPAGLGADAGPLGAAILADMALDEAGVR